MSAGWSLSGVKRPWPRYGKAPSKFASHFLDLVSRNRFERRLGQCRHGVFNPERKIAQHHPGVVLTANHQRGEAISAFAKIHQRIFGPYGTGSNL
jgi:hypothetical protein